MSERSTDPAQNKSRRKFIQIVSASSAAAGTQAIGPGVAALLASNEALAQAALGDAGMATLTKMARDIYPHDRFEDGLYRTAVASYGDQMAKDDKLKKLLTDGVASLDAAAQTQAKKNYTDIASEADRVKILKAMSGGDFFKKLRGDLVVSLYNQPAVWAKLGYQGPSSDQGGYIQRGFDDQTWMAKA